MNEKQLLDVYYYINMDDTVYDVNQQCTTKLIEECLRLQLDVNQKLFHVNKFVNCKQLSKGKGNEKQDKNDIIKSGLLSFNNMFLSFLIFLKI